MNAIGQLVLNGMMIASGLALIVVAVAIVKVARSERGKQ